MCEKCRTCIFQAQRFSPYRNVIWRKIRAIYDQTISLTRWVPCETAYVSRIGMLIGRARHGVSLSQILLSGCMQQMLSHNSVCITCNDVSSGPKSYFMSLAHLQHFGKYKWSCNINFNLFRTFMSYKETFHAIMLFANSTN